MQEFKKKPTKLDISEQLNDAIEIFKKTALTGGFALLSMYLVVFILFSVAMGFFFKPDEIPKLLKTFNPEKLSLNGQMIYVAVLVIFSSLVSPFMAGIIKMMRDADNNEQVKFSTLFTYVNSPLFLDIILATTTLSLISTGSNVFIKHLFISPFATILSNLIVLSIAGLTYLAIPHIIFGQMNFIKAIKTSVTQILAHFFPATLLVIIAFILGIVGIFIFLIGVFFTMPFLYAMQYCIYKKLNP